MSGSIEHWVERPVACDCLALSQAPFADCPECGGTGETYREIAIFVEYDYHRASRGARDRYGAPLEPDEDEAAEITSVVDERGVEVELTSDELDCVEEKCLEDVEERRQDALVARVEARAESRYSW